MRMLERAAASGISKALRNASGMLDYKSEILLDAGSNITDVAGCLAITGQIQQNIAFSLAAYDHPAQIDAFVLIKFNRGAAQSNLCCNDNVIWIVNHKRVTNPVAGHCKH